MYENPEKKGRASQKVTHITRESSLERVEGGPIGMASDESRLSGQQLTGRKESHPSRSRKGLKFRDHHRESGRSHYPTMPYRSPELDMPYLPQPSIHNPLVYGTSHIGDFVYAPNYHSSPTEGTSHSLLSFLLQF